jgi:exopolyphosphatase/guanosine-5'-triphosphate,3'-diphosphate pyrophosphatase
MMIKNDENHPEEGMVTDLSPEFRERIEGIAFRYHDDREHTRQVAWISLRIFDDLKPLHGLGRSDRTLLECAALLHDTGWSGGRKGHHKRSYGIILQEQALPFADGERRVIAAIARYHRKAAPDLSHPEFETLDPPDRRTVQVLAGILRVADGLDVTHQNLLKEISCHEKPGAVICRCRFSGPADAEKKSAEKKSDVFSMVFCRDFVIEPAA